MKLIIFGATGTVGMEIVKHALANNYAVTAFVRNPEKMANIKHANLFIFKGDVRNPTEVEHAIKNHDAVLCALGDGRVGTIRAVGTRNIINAMNKTGIKRLICQTTLGMGESYANLNFIWKHIMFGMLLKKAFQDHQVQEQYLLNSNLNYTIVRPSAFTNGPLTNGFKVGFSGEYKKLKLKISRADVADFMLSQLHTDGYVKKAVSISN
jgi:putative NADH-flavin reductase